MTASTFAESSPSDTTTTARSGRSNKSKASAEDTRARILAAALQTIRADGITGISARSIARQGGFNQALIFYHFGSVEGLLAAVARTESQRRSQLYADALADVNTLPELVGVARRLHQDEFENGNVAALTQMLAGAAGSGELAQGIADALEPWTNLLRETIDRLLATTPYADQLPDDGLTAAATALFLGIELFAGLDRNTDQAALFSTMEIVAALAEGILKGDPPGT